MPIGEILDVLSVFTGGIIGSLAGKRLSGEFKEKITLIFGVCAMAIGLSSIVLMENLPAVILALIIGTTTGHVKNLSIGVQRNYLPLFRQKAATRTMNCW